MGSGATKYLPASSEKRSIDVSFPNGDVISVDGLSKTCLASQVCQKLRKLRPLSDKGQHYMLTRCNDILEPGNIIVDAEGLVAIVVDEPGMMRHLLQGFSVGDSVVVSEGCSLKRSGKVAVGPYCDMAFTIEATAGTEGVINGIDESNCTLTVHIPMERCKTTSSTTGYGGQGRWAETATLAASVTQVQVVSKVGDSLSAQALNEGLKSASDELLEAVVGGLSAQTRASLTKALEGDSVRT